MAKKANLTPASDDEVLATVVDALNRDGQDYAAGDLVTLPVAEAAILRGLGVVSLDDAPAPAAPEKTDTPPTT